MTGLGIDSVARGMAAKALQSGGTVTSVGADGGTTGLTFSGSPITTSGVLLLGGTLGAANGGTGRTSLGTGVSTALGQAVSGSGGIVLQTSPALTTPSLGVATATTINKLSITAPATSATLTIADGKTLTASNILTFAGTDGSTLNVGAGGTLGTAAYKSTGTSGNNVPLLDGNNTWSGTNAFGVATATTINKLTLTAPATSATLTIADGKTLTASNTLTFAGTDGTTMTFPGASASVGYLDIPQNSQSAAYGLVLTDDGKHIYHPGTDNNARTFTIPANASVAFPVGAAITFVNMSAANVTIAITSDTLYLGGTGSTGSRTLAQYGVATALKLTSTTWIITGTGLT